MQKRRKNKSIIDLISKRSSNYTRTFIAFFCVLLLLFSGIAASVTFHITDVEKQKHDRFIKEKELIATVKTLLSPDVTLQQNTTYIGSLGYKSWNYYIGNIINAANGNLYLSFKDVSLKTSGFSLEIIRSYNSFNQNFTTGFGYGWTFNYNTYLLDDNEYILWVDGDGSYHNFTTDGLGGYVSPPGIFARLNKNPDQSYTLWFPQGERYQFDHDGFLVAITDKNDNQLDFIYIDKKLIRIQDISGLYLDISYNENNKISTITDPLGRDCHYSYDVYGNLINVTDATDNTSYFGYYVCHKLSSYRNPESVALLFSYDTSGKRAIDIRKSVYDEEAKRYDNPIPLYLIANDIVNNTAYYVNPTNYVYTIQYNLQGNPVEIIDPKNYSKLYIWENNTIRKYTDENGNLNQYNYNRYGNIIKKIDPLYYETIYEWETIDSSSQYLSLLKNVTKIVYDSGSPVTIFTDVLDPPTGPSPQWNSSMNWSISFMNSWTSPNSWACKYPDPAMWYGEKWDEKLDLENINLSNCTNAQLMFFHMSDFEDDYSLFDGGNIKVSTDHGETWTLVTPQGGYDGKLLFGYQNPLEVQRAFGYNKGWMPVFCDLTPYVGRAPNVTIRFEMGTNNRPSGDSGWFIDNVKIDGYTALPRNVTTQYLYDIRGNCVAIIDPTGNSTSYDYDTFGHVLNATDFLNYTTMYMYDFYGNMNHSIDPLGNNTQYTYDVVGRLLNYTDPNNHTTSYFYDKNDRTTKIIDAQGNVTQYIYNADGALIRMIDANNKSVNYTTNIVGKIEKIQDSAGNVTQYKYNYNGQLYESTDPEGDTKTARYDSRGKTTSVTDALGFKEYYGYDGVGNIIWVMDKNNYITHFEYDKLNRLIRSINPLNGEEIFIFDEQGNMVEKTDKNGNIMNYEYDDLNRLVRQYGAACGCGEKQFSYDANGNRISFTNALNHTTYYEYDPLNRQTKVIDAEGKSVEYQYDAAGNFLGYIDKNGHQQTIVYDELNRIKKVIDATGNFTELEYDAASNVKNIMNARGDTAHFDYDDLYRVIGFTDPSGNTTRFSYNSQNQMTHITDPNNNTVEYVFNARNELVRLIDASGAVTKYEYDPAGKLKKIFDAKNNVTEFYYDALYRLTSWGNPVINNYEFFTYDNNGNLLTAQNANQGTTYFYYDAFNRIQTIATSQGLTQSFQYDDVGNLINRTDYNQVSTTYTYDNLSRITEIQYPVGKVEVTYDPMGSILSVGNRGIGLNDTTYLVYDSLDRPISFSIDYGIFNKTVCYTYDELGQIKTMTDADSKTTTYEYDKAKRLISLITSDQNVTTFGYDPASRRIQTTYPNGVYTTYGYDTVDRLVNITTRNSNQEIITNYSYLYDKVGNRIQMSDHTGMATTYTYDEINRLIDTVYPSGEHIHDYYDAGGNRATRVINDTSYTYYFNDAENHLLSDGTYNYGYDNNGNLISKTDISSTTSYTYDFENRLVNISNTNGPSAEYYYTPYGFRIGKTTADQTQYYFYSFEQIIHELTSDGSTQKSITYGPWVDEPLSVLYNSSSYYYHFDGLKSVTALTNASEQLVNQYTYDAFGNIQSLLENVPNRFTFTGREYDSESGLYFYRERYYDPSLGRMLTKDLPCFSTTLNYYPYADNNPVNVIDPFGLETYQVGGDAQNPLNGDINPNNNPFKVEGAGGSGWFQWCGNSLKYIGNEDPGPNSDSWLPVTVLDENGKESGTRYCPNPDKWQDATDAQLLLILKEELLDKVLGEKDQILRQVLTTYFENNPDNPNVIKIAMRIIKGTLNRECFADIAKDVAILMLEEIIDHFSGEMLGEMGVDEALGLVIDLANGYAGKISPEYKEVSEFLTSSPVIQLLQWANNKIGSVCGGTQITPSPTPSPTPPFQPGRPNQQKITPSPKPSPDPAPEPTPKPPEQPTPPKPPQQSGGTGSSQKGTGASFGDPIEPGNEDDRRGPEFFWFYPDWKFKWWPDYQVTPNGGGWGSPPGEGGYIFIDDPPGYCVYRVVYFGQNAIDDLFENHQALYNAIKWIAKENNMVTTTVLIMPGRGGDEEWSKWIAFEAKYPDISVSRWSDDPIERTTVTYSGLKTKNADVLIDSDHFSATQQGGYYTPEEIEAIQKYLLDEHGYIATSGTLGDTPGQSNQTTSLLSLLGLKETDGNPHKYTNMNSWVFDDPAHPIFFNISSGWNPGGVTGNVDIGICPLCGEPHLSAKIAHLQSTEGNHQSIISAYTIWSPLATNGLLGEAPIGCSVVPQTVYFGNNVIENTGNNHEILYNAIKWAAEHDSTDETKVLIMPGWGGDTGWSQWQTFASAHPDINLTRWSTSSTSRNPVTTYQLEASDADVLIDNEHSSPTQQGGFYTEGELQAIEWYVKTKGNGYIVTSGSVGNHSLQTDQTQTLMQLLGIKQTAIIGQYENSETWIIDQPYHPLIDGIDSWNPGNITGNLDVEKAIKIAHLYSTEDNHQTIISAYEGLEKGSCGCECNIPPVANFTWNPPNPTIQQTIQFSDLSEDIDGTIVNWTWNFGDGNISSLQDPTHYYSAINTYEVTLSVRDNVGDTASRTKTITIIPGGPVVNLNTTEYFLTIQAAINDSDTINGHTIYIGNGTYNEHILLHKRLTLIGENIQTTIIDGSNTSTVLTIVTDFCRLHNLTITRGGTNNCINITHANYTTISDTLLTYSENGIFLGESWYTTIMRNNASHNNDDGVEIAQNSKYTLIQNNSFYHNGAGVFINHATNNTIDHNIIQDSTAFGIQLFDQAHDNRITNNTIQGTTGEQYPQDVDGDAICLFYYSSNPIYRCLVENNILNDNLRGVTLQQTYQTVIRQNNISNCSEIGIKIYSPSNNNQIYHNNIYSNLINANDGGTNIWDDGYPSGGNYWGNYTGFDLFSGPGQNISGSDGIGDTPYNILGKTPPNQDRYPFMVRNGWLLNRPPTQPTDTTSWHIYPGDLYKGIGGYPGRYGGQPVTYQSTSTEAGSDLYFNFSWGDGNNTVVGPVSGFANATHTYGHWGMYNITVTVKHGPSGIPSNSSTARTVNMYKAGDINLDNRVTFADIDPFVETLSGHAAYAAAHPDKYWFTGDTNFNHAVTFADIDPFVALIGT